MTHSDVKRVVDEFEKVPLSMQCTSQKCINDPLPRHFKLGNLWTGY